MKGKAHCCRDYMKKIIASASLVAVGATALHAENVASMTTRQETSKPWTVSAALRGFYDDNYATAEDNPAPGFPAKKGSFGFEVSPSFSWNVPRETTYIGVSAKYGLRYYFDRPGRKEDHSVELTGKLDHKFSNRYSLHFEDSFVYAVEPELIDNAQSTPLVRVDSSGVRNRAAINLRAGLTGVLGLEIGYQNSWYNYLDKGTFNVIAPILNRIEQAVHLDGRWQFREHTVLLMGYQYGLVNFTSSDPVPQYFVFFNSPATRSDVADAMSHYGYVGAEHSISSQLTLAGKVGVQVTDYDNPLIPGEVSPYADASATYTYLPGDSIRLGVRHSRATTDLVGSPGSPTVDQSLTVIYSELIHKLTPMLTGSLQASYQHGKLSGGFSNGQTEDFFLIGLNLNYRLDQYWSVEAGYNFDHLDSGAIERGPGGYKFTRNRVYVGVRAIF